MKNIIKSIAVIGFITLLVTNSSCEKDFLEKPPGIDVTEDTIFSSMNQTLTAVSAMYRMGVYSGYPSWDPSYDHNAFISAASDESDSYLAWSWVQPWNIGTISATNTADFDWGYRWNAIRRANIIIERIDDVPDATEEFKKNVRGEAIFIRALNYWYMFHRYGGVPIIDFRPKTPDQAFLPRRSVESLVDFIVMDCEKARNLLPDEWPENWRGRATKGAALSLKARTLLYAASPLFNTSKPHLSLGDADSLIIYGNEDINRWDMAAKASKDVLDWAAANGVELITDKGVEYNYRYIWENPGNKEIIFADQKRGPSNRLLMPWYSVLPKGVYDGNGDATVTFNFQSKYEKRDGTPQDWNMDGGDDLNEKYAELDYRFHQSIAYNTSYFNVDYPVIETFVGGDQYEGCKGGAWMLKWNPEDLIGFNNVIIEWPVFRLGEFYLNYAEALNEFSGPSPEVYDAVNVIRARSGMPNLPENLTQAEMRERIRHERAIELAFEDHRIWDVLRWKIAKDYDNGMAIMDGSMWGLRITKIDGTDPQEYRYETYVFEERSFPERMYLTPFPQNEVNKGYLIQNPGY